MAITAALTTTVLRNEDFPASDEIGDNFNIGVRSSAIKGVDFEVAGFYQLFKDFQFGESFSASPTTASSAAPTRWTISGVELYGRLNSQPFTGGPLNFFAEGNYTYARSIMKKALASTRRGRRQSGNHLPEVPWHVAALTLGVEGTTGWRWNASTTWTYRGLVLHRRGQYAVRRVRGECECDEGSRRV